MQPYDRTRGWLRHEKKGYVSKGRTNDVCWLDHDIDTAATQIAARVAGLIGMPLSHAERFQLIHYAKGAEYKPHFDAFDPNTSAGKRNWQNGGQRLITVLGYLNTPKKGGGTVFPKLDLTVPAEAGKLVVFHNCLPGLLKRDPKSLHGGAPVEDGEKWAFNLWFRESERH
jgi:prolyl 4-hydroxylase